MGAVVKDPGSRGQPEAQMMRAAGVHQFLLRDARVQNGYANRESPEATTSMQTATKITIPAESALAGLLRSVASGCRSPQTAVWRLAAGCDDGDVPPLFSDCARPATRHIVPEAGVAGIAAAVGNRSEDRGECTHMPAARCSSG